ncbi:MAG: SCP2 sterol-binding domain-containing protein [Propionibacteriales bacterium]|nr:SCP2 sterol-binding domain-containing protein [Propionibacteriales bacterium]
MTLRPALPAFGPLTLERLVAELVAGLDAAPPGPTGVLRVEVVTEDDQVIGWSLGFGPDRVAVVDDPADAAVRIRHDDARRLASGHADGALLYLGGQIEVVGDEQLVLALGSALRNPGDGRPLIDPAALDPVAVATAISRVDLDHLSRVMAGGFRDVVLTEVFGRLPDFLIAEKARGVRVAIMFEVERDHPGEPDRYLVRVADGVCTVQPGAPADAPVDATLVLAGHELLCLVLGRLNPVRAVLSGQLRVRGQVLKALGFNAVMRIPGN